VVTTAPTVADALLDAGVALSAKDVVRPATTTILADSMAVRVVRVAQHKSQVRSRIGFSIRTRPDSSLYKGQAGVLRAGSNGLRVITYLVTTHDGRVASRERLRVQVLRVPTTRVVAYGTRTRPTVPRATGSGVDALNWAALARCESSGNPRAVGG